MNRFIKNIAEFIKLFFIVHGFSTACTVLFVYAFSVPMVERSFLLHSLCFTFTAILPFFVAEHLDEDLKKDSLVLIKILVFVSSECTLLPVGLLIGMWWSVKSGILMAFVILAGNIVINLMVYKKDASLSKKLNEALKRLEREE